MNVLFAVTGTIAVIATVLVIVQRDAVHALLYLIVSLFAIAVIMFLLGAPFIAALEVIVYAGAILVLFVFVVMMIGSRSGALSARAWVGPSVLGLLLLAEIIYVVLSVGTESELSSAVVISPKQVGVSLLGPYLMGAEIAAFLLLAGLVGAYHLGRRRQGEKKSAGKGAG